MLTCYKTTEGDKMCVGGDRGQMMKLVTICIGISENEKHTHTYDVTWNHWNYTSFVHCWGYECA